MDKRLSQDLDVIRGAASLYILVAHSFEWFLLPVSSPNALRPCGQLAYLAVIVFFVLSGYVISNSLIMNWRSGGSVDGLQYLAARSARILPPYAFALLLSVAVPLVIRALNMHGAESFRLPGDIELAREKVYLPLKDLVATILLSQGMIPGTSALPSNGPLWTLSFEVWLYLIALLISIAWDRIARRTGDAYVPLIGLVMVALLLSTSIHVRFQQFSLFWFLGAALRLREAFPHSFLKYIPFSLGAVLIGCLGPIVVFPHKILPLNDSPLGLAATTVIILCGLGYFAATRQWLPPWKITFLRKLARSSYTLFIIHWPLLMFYFSLFHAQFITWEAPMRILFLVGMNLGIIAIAHFAALFLEDKQAWLRRGNAVWQRITYGSGADHKVGL
jgi:hypothetical protein